MTYTRTRQRLQKLLSCLKKELSMKAPLKTFKRAHKEFHSTAYRFLGERTYRVSPLFRDLDKNLRRSGIKISFRGYVSLTIFVTMLVSFATLIIIPCSLLLVLNIPFLSIILFGVGGGLFALAFSIIGFYVYPIYHSDKLKRRLEDELPFTTGYMAILAGAGVSPERIFYSISNLDVPLTVSTEAKDIVRDINLFGLDVISALEKTSKRTPSDRFREMTEGLISTIHSGGNLAVYLMEKSKQYMKLKRIGLDRFSDTLSVLSEFYVALLVTGPLLLVIMLAVMATLGGGNLGMLGLDLLLGMLTYLAIPLGSIAFLLILDAISPTW